jgi:hypothetical protein
VEFLDLDFAVRRSRRYHEKLCAFYGGWRDAVKIVTVIAGSGLFLLVLGEHKLAAELLAGFVALWAMVDYLVAPDKKAEKHCDLCERFIQLAIDIEKSQKTDGAYSELAVVRLEIEKQEPPCKRLVDLAARNDECRAQNYPPEDLAPLSWPQRVFGYFVTFGMKRLEDWKADRQRQQSAASVA